MYFTRRLGYFMCDYCGSSPEISAEAIKIDKFLICVSSMKEIGTHTKHLQLKYAYCVFIRYMFSKGTD